MFLERSGIRTWLGFLCYAQSLKVFGSFNYDPVNIVLQTSIIYYSERTIA